MYGACGHKSRRWTRDGWGQLTHADFDICRAQDTAIMCDIAGAQDSLLDPKLKNSVRPVARRDNAFHWKLRTMIKAFSRQYACTIELVALSL